MKKTAGFTLVELIVVIAILAILAGIAIPVYSGYIEKANEAADLQWLDAIKTAAVFAATEKQVPNTATIDKIDVDANGNVTVTLKEKNDSDEAITYADNAANDTSDTFNVYQYTGTHDFQSKTYKTKGAEWTSDGWKPIT